MNGILPAAGVAGGLPHFRTVAGLFEALASGACVDRGKGRLAKGMGVSSAMKFASWKLEMSELRKLLDSTLARAWSFSEQRMRLSNLQTLPHLKMFHVVPHWRLLFACHKWNG